MFSLEAFYRVYDLEANSFYASVLRMDVEQRVDNCFFKINTTQIFCKQDFGMLGWKQWFNSNEQKEIIEKFPTFKIEPDYEK